MFDWLKPTERRERHLPFAGPNKRRPMEDSWWDWQAGLALSGAILAITAPVWHVMVAQATGSETLGDEWMRWCQIIGGTAGAGTAVLICATKGISFGRAIWYAIFPRKRRPQVPRSQGSTVDRDG
jgi:hypothetical protein